MLEEENDLLESVWPKVKSSCYLGRPRGYENKIDLSLIVTFYNSEIFVQKLVDCLGKQKTKYKYEVILVNDGSTDKTSEILNRCVQKYSMMKVIEQENGGLSKARNAGLNIAEGKYIGFVDGDDLVSENYVEKLLDVAYEKHADIVKCGTINIKNDKIISRECNPDAEISGGMNERILDYKSYAWGGIYKSNLLERAKFPDNYWYEDMITRFLLYRNSEKFVNIGEGLHYRIMHKNQLTRTAWAEKNYKCLEQLYLIEQLVDDNMENGLNDDAYLYMNVLLECSGVMVGRISKMEEEVKKQVFVRVYKLLSGLYKNEYAKYLKGEWKLKSDVIMKKRYDLWRMEGCL